ncbi:MAG: hypothetical protein M5U14_07620 [Acidimicrobiia bacterium]|nr:hypothetical protein [Acidimicrobiia bacterium]
MEHIVEYVHHRTLQRLTFAALERGTPRDEGPAAAAPGEPSR